MVEALRILPFSAKTVWKALTEAHEVQKWWGPKHFSCLSANIHCTTGGRSILCLQPPDEFNMDHYYICFEYTEVIPFKKIMAIQNICTPNGEILQAEHNNPLLFEGNIHTSIELYSLDEDITKIVFSESSPREELTDFTKVNLEQSLEKLEKALYSD